LDYLKKEESMKKQLFTVLSFLILCIGMQAQTNIANYTFATSAGTYVPLTGATTFTTSWDNAISASIPLGGTFTYGTATYTACFISSNGFIAFGAAPAGTNYTPLSAGTYSGAISAFGQDAGSSTAAGATPSISYMNIGGATGEFVIQYTDHANYYGRSTERLNFQIRLNLATGAINIVYGSWNAPGSGSSGITSHVGIRGNSTTWTTNVNSLNTVDVPVGTSCNWANAVTSNVNTSTMLFSNGNVNITPTNGLTFTWAPPVNATLAPVRVFTAVTGITTNGANINWTAPTGATQYNVQYRIPGTCSWTNFSGNPVATTSATLTGLAQNTVYQVRVQSSDATNDAIWSHVPNLAGTGNGYASTGTFSTLATCPPPTTATITAITSNSATATWTVGGTETQWDVYYGQSPLTAPTATTVPTATTSTNTYSITGLNPATNYVFYERANCGAGDMSSWAGPKTFSTTALATDLQTTQLIAPAVSATGCYGSSIPVVIQIKNAGTSVLDFSTNNATVIANLTGPNPQSYTATVSTGTLAANATLNVTVTTTYNMSAVGVYSINATSSLATPDANTSNDAMAVVTRTATSATPAPYTQDFAAGIFPTGWVNNTSWLVATSHGLTNSGIYKNLYSGATSASFDLLKLGTLSGSENITFDFRILNYTSYPTGGAPTPTVNWGNVKVQVSTDCGSTYSTVATIDNTNHTQTGQSWNNKAYSLSAFAGQNVIIRILGTWAVGDFYVDFDNFNIASCFAPTNLTATNITQTSVDIAWVAPVAGTPTSYIGEIRTSGAVGSGTLGLIASGVVTAPTTSANVTGLTALTAYTMYVRSDCGGGDLSGWAAITFTTLADCPVPTGLNTSTVLATSANYTWTAGGTEGAWDIYYGVQPLTVPTATTAPTATSSVASYSATGLTQTTPYSVYVRANCGAGNTSIWTAVKNFTTPVSCPATSFPLISSFTPTSAVATWTAGGAETSWLFMYSAPTTTVLAGPTPSYTMGGLTPSTGYSVQVKGICAVGDSSTWTPVITFTTPCLPPNITSTTPGVRCGVGTVTLAAAADMGGTLNWYANASGGAAISSGTVFTTPTLTTTTDFYVSAIGAITSGAGGRTAPTATANTTASSYGLVFDAVKPFTLNSVDVFPTGTAGNLVVNLTTNTGAVLQTATVAIPTGTVGTPYTVPLNFNVTPGTGYRLIAVSSPSMIRESSLGGFPYSLGQVGNITSGYIGGTSTTYYFFYNWQFSFGCESARTMVTATVNTAPALSVTSGTTICTNAVQTLNITSTLADYDNYVWTPSANLYTDAAATVPYTGGNISTVYYSSSAIDNANYTINASNTVSGCVNFANVSMNADMPVIYASATPTLLCSGNTVSLTANTDIVAPGTGNIGLGNLTTSVSGTSSGNYVSPYSHYYGGYKAQYIVRASELQALGMSAGNITALSFSVTTAGTTYSNFAVSMASTTQSVASTTFNGSVSQVYGPANVTPTTGLNTYTFASPFNWDGTSNVVIQICWSNNNTGGIASEVTYNSTSFVSTSYYRVDNGTSSAVCGQASATSTTSNRPFMILAGQKTTQGVGTVNWQWDPGAVNSNSTTVMPVNTGTVNSVESYTVTALDPATTCTNSAIVSVTVKPIPAVMAMSSSTAVCAGSSATLTAMSATNYTWSSGGTGMTEVVSPSTMTTYTLFGETNGCIGTAMIAVDVNNIPAVSAMASSTLLCSNFGESAILTASTAATSFTWSNGANTMTTSVTPTTGTTYTVVVNDGNCDGMATIFVDAQICMGINGAAIVSGINIYPNPTNGILNVSISSELAGTTSIEVYDGLGKLAIKENLLKDSNTISLSKLEDGIYIFKIINNNKTIKVGKVVKQ
jgi:hypothetical protein